MVGNAVNGDEGGGGGGGGGDGVLCARCCRTNMLRKMSQKNKVIISTSFN